MTSSFFWTSALVAALVDVGLVGLLVRRVSDHEFRQLGTAVPFAGVLFWSALWTAVILAYWGEFYSYAFPLWVRQFPPILGFIYGATGFVLWWLAKRIPGKSVANYCLLGGVEGLVTHIWAIYRMDVLADPPMLRGVSAPSVLTFAFFEKVFYWSAVLGIGMVLWRLRSKLLQPRR